MKHDFKGSFIDARMQLSISWEGEGPGLEKQGAGDIAL